MADSKPSEVERVKAASGNLRGTLAASLVDPLTGSIADDDTTLSKFHGIYQQDDRDVRSERTRQKLEPAYSFMIRARIPGGALTAAQWLALDDIARRHAGDSIRLTTRQAVQFHGVIKTDLKRTIADINAATLDTLAACGDVNRNVMAPALPALSSIHAGVLDHARALSAHLLPATGAYTEIWLDGEKVTSDEEPIYGASYLPRKFKAAFAVPPQNDVDLYAQDLGFVAIVENGAIAGFNVTVGGGMGMTHGDPATYPKLAELLGFCAPGDVLAVAEAVVTTQRDFGDRENRKHARLKYTIDDRGLDWFRGEVERRSGVTFGSARAFRFATNGDVYGWQKDESDRWHYTLFVENGRLVDSDKRQLLSGLRAVAETGVSDFLLTPNQNLILTNIAPQDRDRIADLLEAHGCERNVSPLRRHAMACVGLPTCGLAMAESERYLPTLVDRLDATLSDLGLDEQPITARMTGCANGCARPYVAEIGLVGKAPGRYSLFLGGSAVGDRLATKILDNADERAILSTLTPLLKRYADERGQGERFGDFVERSNIHPAVGSGSS